MGPREKLVSALKQVNIAITSHFVSVLLAKELWSHLGPDSQPLSLMTDECLCATRSVVLNLICSWSEA